MKKFVPEIEIKVSFDKTLKSSQFFKIASSRDAAEILKDIFNADTFNWCEEFIILCVNNSNKVVGFYKVSKGGMTGTVVDVRMVMTIALNCCATGLILAHNHPSGSLQASEADKQITRKLKSAGEVMDIKILDHIILTDESYFSFADDGIL